MGQSGARQDGGKRPGCHCEPAEGWRGNLGPQTHPFAFGNPLNPWPSPRLLRRRTPPRNDILHILTRHFLVVHPGNQVETRKCVPALPGYCCLRPMRVCWVRQRFGFPVSGRRCARRALPLTTHIVSRSDWTHLLRLAGTKRIPAQSCRPRAFRKRRGLKAQADAEQVLDVGVTLTRCGCGIIVENHPEACEQVLDHRRPQLPRARQVVV